jgi:hypothetical protein
MLMSFVADILRKPADSKCVDFLMIGILPEIEMMEIVE